MFWKRGRPFVAERWCRVTSGPKSRRCGRGRPQPGVRPSRAQRRAGVAAAFTSIDADLEFRILRSALLLGRGEDGLFSADVRRLKCIFRNSKTINIQRQSGRHDLFECASVAWSFHIPKVESIGEQENVA